MSQISHGSSAYRILGLIEADDLRKADYLAEFEAIVLDSTWEVLGVFSSTIGSPAEQEIDRRSEELHTFFQKGGLLVVRLVSTSTRLSPSGRGNPDNHNWWARHLGLSNPSVYPQNRVQPLIDRGTGSTVNPLEPGHAFEAYLYSAPPYQARLANYITSYAHVTVLATNRAGEPVAAEIAVEAGSVVIVPPPTHDEQSQLLADALEAALKTRFGLGFEWRLPEELELEKERTAILRELRDKRTILDNRLEEVQRIKAEVFKTIEVTRAINIWREATGPGATPKKAMYALHGMLEMLAGYFSTDWAEVAQKLGVSHKSMKRIAELANRKTLNLRHTQEGKPDDVDAQEYDKILGEAHDIVQAFINYSFREAARLPVSV